MCAALFCDQIEPKSLTLGEVLDGDRMAMSLYELYFGGLQTFLRFCKNRLSHGLFRRCLLLNVNEFKQFASLTIMIVTHVRIVHRETSLVNILILGQRSRSQGYRVQKGDQVVGVSHALSSARPLVNNVLTS